MIGQGARPHIVAVPLRMRSASRVAGHASGTHLDGVGSGRQVDAYAFPWAVSPTPRAQATASASVIMCLTERSAPRSPAAASRLSGRDPLDARAPDMKGSSEYPT